MEITKKITFKPFTEEDIPLYFKWSEEPHVRNTWFLEGYEPVEEIYDKVKGKITYDFPFVIQLDERPIGYIQASDLELYRKTASNPKGVVVNEPPGTYALDLFIGDPELLSKGLGTQIVKAFCQMLFSWPKVKRLVIDPASSNVRAIRCYEKAGFRTIRTAHDGVSECTVMELLP